MITASPLKYSTCFKTFANETVCPNQSHPVFLAQKSFHREQELVVQVMFNNSSRQEQTVRHIFSVTPSIFSLRASAMLIL